MNLNSQTITWILIFLGGGLLLGWVAGNWLVWLSLAVALGLIVYFKPRKS